MIAVLAELATRQELVIVYGYASPPPGSLAPHRFVTALRAELPRQAIVAVLVDPTSPARPPEHDLLAGLLNEGAVAVAVVNVADPAPATSVLACPLDADLALRLVADAAGEPRLEDLSDT
jgi:hypothetical protein